MIRPRTLLNWLMVITIPWCAVSLIIGSLVLTRSDLISKSVSDSADLRSGRILAHAAISAATSKLLEGGENPLVDGQVAFMGKSWPMESDAEAFLNAITAIEEGNQVAYAHWRDQLMLSGFAKSGGNQIGTQAIQAMAAHLSLDASRKDRVQLLDLLSVATVVVTRADRAMQIADQKNIRAESACWYAPLLPPCLVAALKRTEREPFHERARDAYLRSDPGALHRHDSEMPGPWQPTAKL